MSILSNITDFIKFSKKESKAPEGICPNCWGHQEYEGKLYDLMKINKIDAKNIDEKQAFIQKFVTNQLDGIILQRQSDSLVCNNCSTT